MKNMVASKTNVAALTEKPGPQYWENIAAATVNDTMLIQFANLFPQLAAIDVCDVSDFPIEDPNGNTKSLVNEHIRIVHKRAADRAH